MDFWPNLDLSDLAEYGLGLPQYPQPIPNKPFSWRIQSIKKLLPAWCEGLSKRDKANESLILSLA